MQGWLYAVLVILHDTDYPLKTKGMLEILKTIKLRLILTQCGGGV